MNSLTDKADLRVGDHILEVNKMVFNPIALSSAIHVLTEGSRLKLIVRRVGKIPNFISAKERTSWYDGDVYILY